MGLPTCPFAWQWNHNPEPRYWSLAKRPGYLGFVTSQVVSTLPEATNTLTQRTFCPSSSATTSIDVSGMKDGECAGLPGERIPEVAATVGVLRCFCFHRLDRINF